MDDLGVPLFQEISKYLTYHLSVIDTSEQKWEYHQQSSINNGCSWIFQLPWHKSLKCWSRGSHVTRQERQRRRTSPSKDVSSEAGCVCSHLKVWKTIFNQSTDGKSWTGWWFGTWFLYNVMTPIYIGNNMNNDPNWLWLIFFRGVGIPPTSLTSFVHVSSGWPRFGAPVETLLRDALTAKNI